MKIKNLIIYAIAFFIPLIFILSIPRVIWSGQIVTARNQYQQILKKEGASYHVYKNCSRVAEKIDPRFSYPLVDGQILVSCLSENDNYKKLLPKESYFVFQYIQLKDLDIKQTIPVNEAQQKYLNFIEKLYTSSHINMQNLVLSYDLINIDVSKCNFFTCYNEVYYYGRVKNKDREELNKIHAQFLDAYMESKKTIACLTDCAII